MEDDKHWMMIRMVGRWMYLLIPANPGSPRQRAIRRLLLLLHFTGSWCVHAYVNNTSTTRMWANAQRDGRPAKYRWHPLFNAAKFGWQCRAVTLPRRETRRNLQGCPKQTNRSQPLVSRSSPYYEHMWRRYCLFKVFFRLSIYALLAKIQPNKVVRWCRDGDFFASCISSEPRAAHFRPAF